MASTATPAMTATPSPMTTPFVFPDSCIGNWDYTATHITDHTTHLRIFDIGTDSDACNHGQTLNIDNGDLAVRFSPGVCPSGWTAYDLEIEQSAAGQSRKSSATCCPSGFTTSPAYRGGGGACTQIVSQTEPNNTDYFDSRNETIRVESMWLITWAKSDTKSMSPRPPSLGGDCTGAEIHTWVPGAKVKDGQRFCSRPESGGEPFSNPGIMFMMVGLPIIVVAIPSIFFCCVKPRLRRIRRERAREHAIELQEARDASAKAANAIIPGTDEVNNENEARDVRV
ncbi:hypothetical protein PWT90_01486 [Aphanocladium album]|nr:hypothetical protein PWT90_01486 [Aphanocladium album]